MKKNLFEEKVKDEIIHRSLLLTDDTKPNWGTMNSPEMLHHCANAIRATIKQKSEAKASTTKQKVARFLMLNILSSFPKGAKTPKVLDVKLNKVSGLTLTNELANFEDALNEFYTFDGNINTTHPYFGNLSRRQWGILTWMHMDHHLRQFGV
jgi:hypothetical protein